MITTKFYLHGGSPSALSNENIKFRENIIKDISHNPKVLFCYFAKEKEEWESSFAEHIETFKRLDPSLEFLMASEDNFVNEIKDAELIYFSGGDSFVLIEKLNKIHDFNNLLRGKIVVGVSAGACALSKYFYSNDQNKVAQGLGILNLKIHCHYAQEKLPNIDTLNLYNEKLEILAIPEQSSVIIFK